MSHPNKFAAVDSDVLLALEAGDEECQEAIDCLSKLGFYFIVTETAMQELADIVEYDPDGENKEHAKNALIQITNWMFLPSSLPPLQMGISEQIARELISKFIIEGELNDGLVLGEAACNNCRVFLTKNDRLLSANRISIQMCLINADLGGVFIGSPSEWVAVIKKINTEEKPKSS